MLLMLTIISLMVVCVLQLNRKRNIFPRSSDKNAADNNSYPNPLYYNNQSMYVLYSLGVRMRVGGGGGEHMCVIVANHELNLTLAHHSKSSDTHSTCSFNSRWHRESYS